MTKTYTRIQIAIALARVVYEAGELEHCTSFGSVYNELLCMEPEALAVLCIKYGRGEYSCILAQDIDPTPYWKLSMDIRILKHMTLKIAEHEIRQMSPEQMVQALLDHKTSKRRIPTLSNDCFRSPALVGRSYAKVGFDISPELDPSVDLSVYGKAKYLTK